MLIIHWGGRSGEGLIWENPAVERPPRRPARPIAAAAGKGEGGLPTANC